jgi:hypothetical protein
MLQSTYHQFPGELEPIRKSGYHTQGTPQMFGQKRYQVTSMWNGLSWKAAVGSARSVRGRCGSRW